LRFLAAAPKHDSPPKKSPPNGTFLPLAGQGLTEDAIILSIFSANKIPIWFIFYITAHRPALWCVASDPAGGKDDQGKGEK
jgi:hypothetical protein